MKKALLLLMALIPLLSSCDWDWNDDPPNCEQVRISPSNEPAYWVTICADDGGGIPVTNTGGQK